MVGRIWNCLPLLSVWPGEEARNVISCTINANNSKYLGVEHAHCCGVSSLPWLQLEQSHLEPVCLGRAALRNEVTLEKTFLHSWQMDKNIWTSTGLGKRAGVRVKHRAWTSGARAAGPNSLPQQLVGPGPTTGCATGLKMFCSIWPLRACKLQQMISVLAENCFAAQWLTYWLYRSDIRTSALPIAVRVSWTVLWDRVHSTVVNQRLMCFSSFKIKLGSLSLLWQKRCW